MNRTGEPLLKRPKVRILLRVLLGIVTVLALILVPGIVAGSSDTPTEAIPESEGTLDDLLLVFVPIGIIVLIVVLGIARNRSNNRRDLNRVRSEYLSGRSRPVKVPQPRRPPDHRPSDY